MNHSRLSYNCVHVPHSYLYGCFEEMQRDVILLDAVTFTCILKARATIIAVDKGKQIHAEISMQRLLQNQVVLGNSLVDMYAKGGVRPKCFTLF